MSKILITGGAGFIGAHVGRALAARGDEIVVLDDFNGFIYTAELKRVRVKKLLNDPKVKIVEGNILDIGLVDRVMKEENIEKVLHLAAHPNPARSVDAMEEYTRVNLMGTVSVLHAAFHNQLRHAVCAGSSSVYDDSQTPFREDAYPLRPQSPYGASKAAAEIYARMWHDLRGLPITVLRFFSVYGPYGRPDMAPLILADRLLRGEKLEVSKDRKRDFTFIDDVVSGVAAALDKELGFEVVNLGRGEPIDILDFVKALEAAAGEKADYEWREAPEGEMRVTYADISKARKLLGYEPKVSVEEGTRKLVEWMRDGA